MGSIPTGPSCLEKGSGSWVFNCAACKQSIGPKISPIKAVSGTRTKEYHNEYFVEDEWGNKEKKEVDSVGTEITGERLVCPTCAQLDVPAAKPITVVGGSFREKPADTFTQKLISVAIQNMLERLTHQSKRAKRDAEATVPNIKRFVDDNKELVI